MAQNHPPRFDQTTRTLFLRLTIARAMTPRMHGPQRLVEAAEQIELKLWVQPHAHRKG